MGYSNGSIYAPVSIRDVQRALGTSVTNLGRLCKHDNINKWARYKPVIYPGFPIRFQSGIAAFENKTGLQIGNVIDVPSSVALWTDYEIGYDRPLGTINSPYRLTDFVKYNHYAQKPVEIYWKASGFKLDKGFGCSVQVYDRSTAEEHEYISFSDLMTEVSGYDGFKRKLKRLCLAVIEETSSAENIIWYFFSETFSTTAGITSALSVSTNMFNANFTNLLTIGNIYRFVVMIVSNHSYLEDTITGDRERWEFGVSPADMNVMETDNTPIQAMSLALERDADRTTEVLQQASVITDLTYFLDILSADKFRNNVTIGYYNILCMQLLMPSVTVRSPQVLNSSAQFQLRFQFNQGSSSYAIFRPTDKVGNNYYEIESTPETSLNEIALTSWVTVSDIGGYYGTGTDSQGNIYYAYEFDFPNRINTILSQTMAQTSDQSSGLFLFFDQDGDSCELTFKLYYKEDSTQGERVVRTFSVTYNSAQNSGNVHDIEF